MKEVLAFTPGNECDFSKIRGVAPLLFVVETLSGIVIGGITSLPLSEDEVFDRQARIFTSKKEGFSLFKPIDANTAYVKLGGLNLPTFGCGDLTFFNEDGTIFVSTQRCLFNVNQRRKEEVEKITFFDLSLKRIE